jgi:hypothetical protein
MRLVLALFSRSLPVFYPFQAGLASLDGTANTGVVWKPDCFRGITIWQQKKRASQDIKNNINEQSFSLVREANTSF